MVKWRDIFLKKRVRPRGIKHVSSLPLSGITRDGFLKQAIEASVADATKIIQQKVVSVVPVDTGNLRASITFPPFSSTGTIWNAERYFPESPIWGRRVYIEAWRCPWCERLNLASSIACADCGHGRLTSSQMRSIPQDWKCEWCEKMNYANPTKCAICGGKR